MFMDNQERRDSGARVCDCPHPGLLKSSWAHVALRDDYSISFDTDTQVPSSPRKGNPGDVVMASPSPGTHEHGAQCR